MLVQACQCSLALSLSKVRERIWLTLPPFFVCANTCKGIHLESLLRMFYSAMKRENKDGDSWLNASDHLCQCHHCICHRGMKPPRQATQWGGGSGEGVGNKLWLLQCMKRQWMIEWLNKLDVRKLCAATVWVLGVHKVRVIHSVHWNNDLRLSVKKTNCTQPCWCRCCFQSYPKINTSPNAFRLLLL